MSKRRQLTEEEKLQLAPRPYTRVTTAHPLWYVCNQTVKDAGGNILSSGPAGPYKQLGLTICRKSGIHWPGAKKAIAQGTVINNPYSVSTITYFGGGGSYGGYSPINGSFDATGPGSITAWLATAWGGYNAASLPEPPTSLSDVVADLKLSCLDRIDKSKFGFGEDIAEIGKLIDTLKHPVDTIYQLAEELAPSLEVVARTKGKKKKKAAMSRLARTYLAVKYGLVQVIWTAANAADLYRDQVDQAINAQYTKPKMFPKRFTARANKNWTDQNSADVTVAGCVFSGTRECSRQVRVGILYEVRDPSLREGFPWKVGLRAKDILPTAWAVMPMSWLVDQYVNIGHCIRAVENLADPDVHVLAGYIGVKTVTRETLTATSYNPRGIWSSDWEVTVSGDTVGREEASYNRSPWVPSIADVLPNVQVPSVTGIAETAIMAASKLKEALPALKQLTTKDLGYAQRRYGSEAALNRVLSQMFYPENINPSRPIRFP